MEVRNETAVSGENWMPDRETEQGIQRTGCEQRLVMCVGNGQLNQSMGGVTGALNCMHDQQIVLHDNDQPSRARRKYVVRRLTPIECLRLQGLPDWWCDGVNGSDSAIYKMCGNGIAIPCAVDVLGRIALAIKEGEYGESTDDGRSVPDRPGEEILG